MPRFLLLFSSRPDRGMREWTAREAASGVIRSGARLEAGWRVAHGDGVTTVGEAAPLWGFAVIEAEDPQAALAVAAGCPVVDPGTVDLYRLELGDAVGEALADAATLR